MATDPDTLRHIVLGIWHEQALERGEERRGGPAGYPILTVNGITLVAAPVEVPKTDFYEPSGSEMDIGIAYCFVDTNRRIVDNFEGERKHCQGMTATFEEFFEDHGVHFQGIEPKRMDFRF